MSNVKFPNKLSKDERKRQAAIERSRRNQQANAKRPKKQRTPKDPSTVQKTAVSTLTLPKPGQGKARAQAREEAREGVLKALFPNIETKAQRRQRKFNEQAANKSVNVPKNRKPVPAAEVEVKYDDLTKKTVPELRKIAQDLGVKGVSKLTKPVLIKVIEDHGV